MPSSAVFPRRARGPLAIAAVLAACCTGSALAATDFDAERKRCEAEASQSVKVVCLRDLKAAMAGGASAAASAPAGGTQAAAKPAAAGASAAMPAAAGASAAGQAAADGAAGGALYQVTDGNKVDAGTMEGFRTWRAAACDRCHGPNQEGLVGPSLINSLKTLSKQDFVTTVTNGRLEKGMPSFKANQTVMKNIDHLYAYLKGRSDGAIKTAHVQPMK